MKNKYLTILIAATLPFTGGYSHAAPKTKGAQSEASVQQQAAEYKIDTTGANTTILTEQAIEKARAEGVLRDQLHSAEVLNDIQRGTHTSKLQALEAERNMLAAKFIVENVPAHIIAAGDKVVQSYITQHFVETKTEPKTDSVKTIWQSTSSAMAAPISTQPPAATVVPPQTTRQPAATGTTPPESKVGLSESERAALGQLGLSEKELSSMFGEQKTLVAKNDSKNNGANKKNDKKVKKQTGNISISKIVVERFVFMGTSKFVDVALTFDDSRGGNSRKKSIRLQKVGPGHLFNVDGVKFELVSVNEQQIVFQNLETKKTFLELVN